MITRNLPAAAAIRPAPTMPTVEKHSRRHKLSPSPSYREGANGELIDGVDWSIQVYRNDLIPEPDCELIIAEVTAATMPTTGEIAARLATVLVGAYPAREMSSPEIFVRMITSVFEEVPEDIGLEAVDRITRQSKFLPSRAEVFEACDNLLRRRRFALLVAQQHLEMHAELKRERAAEATRKVELQHPHLRVIHRWVGKFSRGSDVSKPRWRWGVVEPEWRAAVERWVAAYGIDEVQAWHQAIADMPEPPACGIMAELERLAGEAAKAGRHA